MAEFQIVECVSGFAYKVKRKARHVLDDESKRFLGGLLETSEKRRKLAKRGSALWRAQLGHGWRKQMIDEETEFEVEIECAFDAERMTPLPDRATEGGVNLKGIPCLYLCTDMKTAMSEVRPWIGSYVSVAQFMLLKDLEVLSMPTGSRGANGNRSVGVELYEWFPRPGILKQRTMILS